MQTKTKLTALALAVLLAIGTGGVAAATGASSGTDEPADEPHHQSTIDVDGYEFTVSNEDDGFGADRTAELEAIPAMVLNDDEAGDWLRDHVETDDLVLEVYGSLQRDDDSAHVRIHPDRTAEHGDARPLLEATVDTDTGTVDVVGTDTDPVESDTRLEATEATDIDVSDRRIELVDDGAIVDDLSTDVASTVESVTRFDVRSVATGDDGETFTVDTDADDTDGASTDAELAVRDPDGELTDAELETVRTLVTNDEEATERLRDRFPTAETITLAVHGVEPTGDIHVDATAPGDNHETAVVVSPSSGDVSVDAATLLETSESSRIDTDGSTVVWKSNDT
ncbi:hypothetical protein A6E15_16370 [Natrinema saccharevitans]|uniref:Uncharacterized protein n=1 Tax=Natrinema saccharevitans TaxID=301967 RepID=A0A1S8B075_9EURY|nr:hypothetical protein [Natrinema saccharevitans]OLZ42440.1 hypothetical protein A6E15_16370 [Natrinema saccharevitans]